MIGYDRRAFLRHAGSASATAVAATLAGCTSGATGGESGDGGSGSGGAAGAAAGDGDNTVDMNDQLDYVPKKLAVSVGTTVTWKNVGRMPHSVTAYGEEIPDDADYFASGGFDTEKAARRGYPAEGKIAADEQYEYTFEVPGTYEYFCIPHEATNMIGTVEVTE